MNISNFIEPIEKPTQHQSPRFSAFLHEVDVVVRASTARRVFGVTGKEFCVAVLDSGINKSHVDFYGKILTQVNFTSDNNSDSGNAADGHGHGTNVSGIIVAEGDRLGIAPEAKLIPLKVLNNSNGGGKFDATENALTWVIDNHKRYNISVVCISYGGGENFQDDSSMADNEVRKKIIALKNKNIPVVIASGNNFFRHQSREGMSFPAIIRESISVGAIYDNNEGTFDYPNGSVAFSTSRDQITPFSQRLHPNTPPNPDCYTDIFAPGAPVTSSGIIGDHGESTQHGTSQATPVICGVILLAQELYYRIEGKLPTVDKLKEWIRASGVKIHDGDDEADNVENTNKQYIRIDAVRLLSHMIREWEVNDSIESGASLPISFS